MTHSTTRAIILYAIAIALTGSASAMERTWTRMTGQYRVEATPLVEDLEGDGSLEIVVVNVEGQVLCWKTDGTPLGSGPDGQVAQLPQGRWTSKPLRWGERLLFGSVEGVLVALDLKFQPAWQLALGAETTWSRGVPVKTKANGGDGSELMALGDSSGKITLINYAGAAAAVLDPKSGPCRTLVQTCSGSEGQTLLLAACGNVLNALDSSGKIVWAADLGGTILSQPEVLNLPERTLILCGAGKGILRALDINGQILWKTDICMEIDSSITVLPREGTTPLILCTGLWGNLYAFEVDGKKVWEQIFRSKNRARPLLTDADGDGDTDVVVATYRQTLLAIDADGRRIDEIRLNGSINASPVLLPRPGGATADVLVISTTMQAHCLSPGPARAAYGGGEPDANVKVTCSNEDGTRVCVDNPSGALLRVNVAVSLAQGGERIFGRVSARSTITLECASVDASPQGEMTATIQSPTGAELLKQSFPIAEKAKEESVSKDLACYAVDPFSDASQEPADTLRIENLYRNEAGEGAFEVRSNLAHSIRARLSIETPTNAESVKFAGTLAFYEMTPVGTVNGETVKDALVALAPEGLLQVPPKSAAKIWLSVNAGKTPPGEYKGKVICRSLEGNDAPFELPLCISVLDLEMPADYPLALCTWDYLPNQWFPDHTPEILQDMHAHGVNLFPRSVVPVAELSAAGELKIDWTKLDAELDRLDGLGQILFHIGRPAIQWPQDYAETQKRPKEIEFLCAFRDHLTQRGWTYDRYAFYPVDEPGLDYGKNTVPAFLEAATLFREADPKLRIYTDPVPSLSWADFERIDPYVDIWCPNMRLVTGLVSGDPRIRRIMDSKKTVWSYECVSQVKSLSPLCYNRANAWRGYYFGLSGIGFWTFSTTQVDLWYANATKNDEYALVYPGERPTPSVRWESARDGLEDVAAMDLLKKEIERQRGNPSKAEVVSKAEGALRIAQTDILELSDEAYIESRDFLEAGDRRIWHEESDSECFKRHRKAIAELTLELRK